MASSGIALPMPRLAASGGLRPSWIISMREDLTWFVGSPIAGYVALGLQAIGLPFPPLLWFWALVLDGPHVLATVTRTHFDREERARLGYFLWITIPLLLVGPVAAKLGYASWFFLFAVCWQQYHVVKQHFGFIMLYKAKNGERGRTDYLLDRALLLASLFLPLAYFVIRTHSEFGFLGFFTWLALPQYALLVFLWIGRQFQKLRRHSPMNWPKLGLLAGIVPLQWLALTYAADFGANGIMRAASVLGIVHSLQYHRLLWFHNRNRYATPGAEERHGLAARFAASFGIYAALAVGLNFALNILPPLVTGSVMAQSAVWGFAFTHFLLDARIWHPRNDAGLASALRI